MLDGSIMALKMRECCSKLRVQLLQKKSVEQAFICYNVRLRASLCSLFENHDALVQELSALIKTSVSNRLPDQEIDHLLALKQKQKIRKENLMVKDDAADLQQDLDF